MELSHTEIIAALFAARDKHLHIDVLISLILDLFMEVEALREALIKIDGQTFAPPLSEHIGTSSPALDKSNYQKAYLEAAYETHNNGGPLGGLDKLLAKFYPASADDLGRTWRECLLLERLGFSPAEVAEYKNAAQDAEMLP